MGRLLARQREALWTVRQTCGRRLRRWRRGGLARAGVGEGGGVGVRRGLVVALLLVALLLVALLLVALLRAGTRLSQEEGPGSLCCGCAAGWSMDGAVRAAPSSSCLLQLAPGRPTRARDEQTALGVCRWG